MIWRSVVIDYDEVMNEVLFADSITGEPVLPRLHAGDDTRLTVSDLEMQKQISMCSGRVAYLLGIHYSITGSSGGSSFSRQSSSGRQHDELLWYHLFVSQEGSEEMIPLSAGTMERVLTGTSRKTEEILNFTPPTDPSTQILHP